MQLFKWKTLWTLSIYIGLSELYTRNRFAFECNLSCIYWSLCRSLGDRAVPSICPGVNIEQVPSPPEVLDSQRDCLHLGPHPSSQWWITRNQWEHRCRNAIGSASSSQTRFSDLHYLLAN
eukprot:scaffold22532_cov93-Cylindrotheca_fusiformis.AAC.3